jgi:hypothetical protein
MAYEQHIPFYIHKFKDFPWKTYETEHYVFNVEADSLADREIEIIKTRQEAAYKKIIESLSLEEAGRKITYYFYPSQEKKAELMGDEWYGQSIYDEFTVHAVYNERDKVVGEHEDTHLLTLQLGFPISFLQEGIAEAMVGKSMFGNEHNSVVSDGIKNGISLDLSSLMSQQGWLDTPDEEAEFYYSVAGSFTRYILDTIGIDKFKELYPLMDRQNSKEKNIEVFKTVVGKDLDTVENDWRRKFLGEV